MGNGIYNQLQLVLYGAVLDAVYLYNKYGAPLDYEVWQSLRTLLGWLSRNWHQPDAGMWDVRDSREHFVSSKVLSWVALDRGIRLAYQRGLPADEEVWIDQRDAVYEEVMSKGWNTKKGSFVRHYGSEALDASLLLMPVVEFVGPTDPRWLATLDRVQKELTYDVLVERYEGSPQMRGLRTIRVLSVFALSGWWSALPGPDASMRPDSLWRRCSPTPITSGYMPKR